jgi:multisubunit Na+/H+ antiporter MnhB subunit
VKSVLLQQASLVLVPLALAVGVALLLKGHDEPGGGFVAGLALGMAGVLALASYGLRKTRLGISAELGAVVGIALTVLSLLLPLLGGDAMLTHASGTLPVLGKWHGALLFDVGVMLAVGCGSMAAAQALWATPANGDQEHGNESATGLKET